MLKKLRLNLHRKKKPELALFHITHWKSGSQWIYKILKDCLPDRIVVPQNHQAHFLQDKVLPGKIYPTVYVTLEQFENINPSFAYKRFIIIRDLRDTLISLYFSIKISHPLLNKKMIDRRKILTELNQDDALISLMNNELTKSAAIQQSWLKNKNEPILHYEQLLQNDIDVLLPILKDFDIPESKIIDAIIKNRFENSTQNRKLGEEDINSHLRKGLPGDWKNYFTTKIKEEFKNLYGDLLIDTGYERNHSW